MMTSLMSLLGGTRRYPEISVAQLDAIEPGTRIIDVREPAEFEGELGHLPDAELVPLGGLTRNAKNWPRDVPLLMVCRSGNRSGQACSLLNQLGFSNVTNLKGGMLAVRASGK
jgi:rhodanese-related sulfurtransferase